MGEGRANSWKERDEGTRGGAGGEGDVFKASPSSRSSVAPVFCPFRLSSRPALVPNSGKSGPKQTSTPLLTASLTFGKAESNRSSAGWRTPFQIRLKTVGISVELNAGLLFLTTPVVSFTRMLL